MKLGDVTQIILYVKDMAKLVEFYRDGLGLEINFPIQDDYSEESWVAFKTGRCTLALHAGGDGRVSDHSPKFTFEVDDVDKAMNLLDSRGVAVGNKREAYPGSYVAHGRDPERNVFFIQSHPH
ncbi:MAG: VOC family protein [Candidatus Kariarchaeaceae archaeon]|jgi:predicted enzyme related to lactoylglutathione lyase